MIPPRVLLSEPPGPERTLPVPAMPLDVEKYRTDIQALGVPPEQQDEVIHILWRIAESFADRAFGLDQRPGAGVVSALADCCDAGQPIGSDKGDMRAAFAANAGNDRQGF